MSKVIYEVIDCIRHPVRGVKPEGLSFPYQGTLIILEEKENSKNSAERYIYCSITKIILDGEEILGNFKFLSNPAGVPALIVDQTYSLAKTRGKELHIWFDK